MRILVTGSAGQVGREVLDLARAQGHETAGLARQGPDPCDITDPEGVQRAVTEFGPDVVIHAAAMTDVDGCELEPDRARAINEGGTANVAEAADEAGAHLVYVSTDYVFDGETDGDYVETDAPNPLSGYGRSKLAGEAAAGPDATIVRTSWVCGVHGRNVVRTVLGLAAKGQPLRFVDDQVGQPTFVSDLAPRLLDLGADRRGGVWHVSNVGPMSWYAFVGEILDAGGYERSLVSPISTAELDPPRPAPRPRRSVLDGAALRAAGDPPMPPVRPSLDALVDAIQAGT
ncbi:dTDP-4-dehydrorhamnose reductase [Iamia sp. SCSIO 61187]|uniref:dTDP-4-dehydrorhamnose reductase n=1 Tax=Iamia sp. SCSIO 61187 TaxID=2722752 RepID=UPI001C6376CD|nr:dTDP-4-dehydrorhamnose reductase [Iamia sp. SCSIO 61187]QYG92337.1 dTDP-4-dehydrorhamnose reductase [Iamia sp. SCSIO 61187]